MNNDAAVPRLEKILPELGSRFSENVTRSLSSSSSSLEAIELKARAVAVIGELLRNDRSAPPHRVKLTQAFDEVFADLILSCYLAAAGLDNPACSVLRRAFETGIAITFLWDSPCAFYGWTAHDKDLSFRAMVEFVASDSYKTLLLHETSGYKGQPVIEISEAEALYRALSNVTHGKWATFESPLPDRFSHNVGDWTTHLVRLGQVESILLYLWKLRFEVIVAELHLRIPALEKTA